MNRLENFKKDAYQYGEIDSLIKKIKSQLTPLQKALKLLNMDKKIIQKDLCVFMANNKINTVNLTDVKQDEIPIAIKYSVTNALVPVTHSHVKDNLIKFFKDRKEIENIGKLDPEEQGNYVYNYIYAKENRLTKLRENIRTVKFVDNVVEQIIEEEEY